jgi:hypothetical protein
MPKLNDLSRSLTVLKGDSTLIAVIEMSQPKLARPSGGGALWGPHRRA